MNSSSTASERAEICTAGQQRWQVIGYHGHVLIQHVQHSSYIASALRVIQGYSYTCRSGLISHGNAGVHTFVYLICGNSGDTTGKIHRMKGIHLLPHACTRRHIMPTTAQAQAYAYMHACICMLTHINAHKDRYRLLCCIYAMSAE